jgi:hypothetical protein
VEDEDIWDASARAIAARAVGAARRLIACSQGSCKAPGCGSAP